MRQSKSRQHTLRSFPNDAASCMVRHARHVLDHYRVPLMRIALIKDDDGEDEISCSFFSFDFAELEDVPRLCEASCELPVHAAIVLRNIRANWPPHIQPPEIAIVTDGSGLVFWPSMPRAHGNEWLALLSFGKKTWVNLLPNRPYRGLALFSDLAPADLN